MVYQSMMPYSSTAAAQTSGALPIAMSVMKPPYEPPVMPIFFGST